MLRFSKQQVKETGQLSSIITKPRKTELLKQHHSFTVALAKYDSNAKRECQSYVTRALH